LLIAEIEPGQSRRDPDSIMEQFERADLQPSPDEVEAARVLTNLLLGRTP